MLMKIEYEIKSDTEMVITVSAMFGLAKESDTVTYELNGDTLVFDGATYTRVKQVCILIKPSTSVENSERYRCTELSCRSRECVRQRTFRLS